MTKDNQNQIIKREHDESLAMKKTAFYGWDGSQAVMLKVDANGVVETSGGGSSLWQRTSSEGSGILSPLTTGDSLSIDVINEEGSGNGVTIDSVLLKDGGATLTDDFIIDTDLFFVDVSAQTINVNNSTSIDQILDEDSMVTDSAMALATQQSIKAYVDNSTGAYLPLAGGVMTGDITLAESVTSVKTGAYSGYFSSGATSVGAPPSDTDPNIISYWKMDDNGIFPEDADDANLEAWWKFETGSGTVLVDELGVHNGSISNATWTGSGAFNASTNSLTFDGSNDSVGSFASTTDFDYTAGGAFTVAAWVYIDSASTTDMTVATNLGNPLSGSAKGWGMFVRSDDKVQFGMQESGGIYKYMKSSALSANTWYYVVGTWDNGSLNLYINGVLDNATPINSGTVTSTTPAFGTMTIGNSSTSTWDFYGKIDDVAIYNDARTADEILRDYDTTKTTITVDSVGTNHGTLSGATWVGSGAFGYTGDDSLSFDGVNDFVACSSSSQLSGTNKFTIQGWAKQDTLDVQAGLFEQITSATNRVMMATWSDGNIYAVVANGGNSYGTFDYSAYVTAGEWFMFAMVYDGTATGNANRLKAYINGVQITLSFTGTIPATLGTNSADFDIGIQTNGGATEWNGDLDNFMIYDDVRSAAEILLDYNNSQSSGGNAWVFDTSNVIGSAGTLMQWKNNGTTKAYITGAGGLTLEDDLIIDTDLLFVDVSAQTVNINNSTSVNQVLDEDDMATNSAMALATQQSIKAYTDASILSKPYVAKTGTYTASATDYTIDCTANTFTVTLPTAVGITGRVYIIKNSGTGTITVDGNASETIDGATTVTLNQYDHVKVQSNGVGWIVIG